MEKGCTNKTDSSPRLAAMSGVAKSNPSRMRREMRCMTRLGEGEVCRADPNDARFVFFLCSYTRHSEAKCSQLPPTPKNEKKGLLRPSNITQVISQQARPSYPLFFFSPGLPSPHSPPPSSRTAQGQRHLHGAPLTPCSEVRIV